MIKTRTQLIQYVRSMLGEPIITVEVTDEQISQIIDSVIQQFTEYAPHYCQDTVILEVHGKGDYRVPERITHIIKLSKGQIGSIANFSANYGADYVPDVWSNQFFSDNFLGAIVPTVISISNLQATMGKLFGDEIAYHFDPYKSILRVFDDYEGPVFLHYIYRYVTNDDGDAMFDQEWVKRSVIARTKHLWGSIMGKYTANLVGGASINYSDIKSDAESELQDLKEELLMKWSDPAPVAIG